MNRHLFSIVLRRAFAGSLAFAVASLGVVAGVSGPAGAAPVGPEVKPAAATKSENQTCSAVASDKTIDSYCGKGFNAAGIRLEIAEMTPIVGEDTTEFKLRAALEVTAKYRGSKRGVVTLRVAGHTPVTREELSEWMDPAASNRGILRQMRDVTTVEVKGLEAGKTQNVEIRVPVEDLPLQGNQNWGPRPLQLTFRPETAGGTGTGPNATGPTGNGHTEDQGKKTTGVRDGIPGEVAAADRSFLLWKSPATFEPSQLVTFVPVTTTRADLMESGSALADLAEKPSTRLKRVCELAQNTPLTPVFDPLLLAGEVNGKGEAAKLLQLEEPTPTASATSGNPDSNQSPDQTFAELVKDGKCGTKPAAFLPPGDFAAANLSWLEPDQERLLTQAAAGLNETISEKIAGYPENMVLWPDLTKRFLPSGDIAKEALTWGDKPILLDEAADFQVSGWSPSYDLDARREIAFAPRGKADTAPAAEESAKNAKGWVLDKGLSRLLEGKPDWNAGPAAEKPEDFRISALTARQWALASTAVLTRQRPFGPRLFVAGTGRDYAANATQKTVMEGLKLAPWLSFPAWDTVKPGAETDPPTVTVPAPQMAGVKDTQHFSTLTGSETAGNPGVTVLENPAFSAAANLRAGAALQSSLSNADGFATMFSALQVASVCASCTATLPDGTIWSGTSGDTAGSNLASPTGSPKSPPTTATDMVPNVVDPDISTTLLGLIKAQPASVINLIDTTAKLPISVSNGLNQEVNVRLQLTASDSRLQFSDADTLNIAAHSIGQSHIPVKAVGSGDVEVKVQLTNPQGEAIGNPETIKVRVRAEWESTGTYIVAGLLAFILVFGIVRRMIKGPKNRKREGTA